MNRGVFSQAAYLIDGPSDMSEAGKSLSNTFDLDQESGDEFLISFSHFNFATIFIEFYSVGIGCGHSGLI